MRLVRLHEREGEGADELASRLLRTFDRFPPSEANVSRLAELQKSLQGQGGVAEFCVTMVFSVASLAASRHALDDDAVAVTP